MSRRYWYPLPAILAATFLLFVATTIARGQLHTAYENGYKPMLDLSSKLKELADSSDKRQDYSAVGTLGNAYKDRLGQLVAGLTRAGEKMSDSSNLSWVKSSCSGPLAAATKARSKAEKLAEKGDRKEDCRAEVIDLQASLTEVSDEFRKCWKDHEDRRVRVMDEFMVSREKWFAATKDDRRGVDDLGRKASDARERVNDLQARAAEAGKLYMSAQDQCDRARTELFSADASRTPDDVKSRYENWAKAEDLVKRVSDAATVANKAAEESSRNYSDAQAAWARARDDYTKEAVEGDAMYRIVRERQYKCYEIYQEYKPFSM